MFLAAIMPYSSSTVVYRITEPWLGAKKMALLSVLALLSIQTFLIAVVGEPRKIRSHAPVVPCPLIQFP